MPNITLGKVKFIHRGAYNASRTVYSKGDIVELMTIGCIFLK